MRYGYARVSLENQSLDLQFNALESAGCDKVFAEKISSRKKDRPELKKLLRKLKKGDEVVCYKLDRLGRSLKDLVTLITTFEEKDIRFVSLSDSIDTKSSSSKLLINILMCIADYERSVISLRTKAGLEAARKRGVKLGRPKGVLPLDMEKVKKVKALSVSGLNPTEIKRKLGLSRPTIYKYQKLNI